MRVMVIENEPDVVAFRPTRCRESANAVDQAANWIDGLGNAVIEKYNAIVFDPMLRGMDGLSILR